MLPILKAEQQLDALEPPSFPYMETADRRRVLAEKQKQIGATGRPKRATADDLAALGIPVTFVKKEPA